MTKMILVKCNENDEWSASWFEKDAEIGFYKFKTFFIAPDALCLKDVLEDNGVWPSVDGIKYGFDLCDTLPDCFKDEFSKWVEQVLIERGEIIDAQIEDLYDRINDLKNTSIDCAEMLRLINLDPDDEQLLHISKNFPTP